MITEGPIDVDAIDTPTDIRAVLAHGAETPLFNDVLNERKLSKNKISKLAKGWPNPTHGPADREE